MFRSAPLQRGSCAEAGLACKWLLWFFWGCFFNFKMFIWFWFWFLEWGESTNPNKAGIHVAADGALSQT